MPSKINLSVQVIPGTGKQAVILQTLNADALDPLFLCRFLKAKSPDTYRQVWYEMDIPANGNGLVLPDNIADEVKPNANA